MNQLPQGDRERLNTLVMASREYEAQAEQVQMQLEMINQTISVTRVTEETVKNLEHLQDGQEILLPLGNLAFIKAKVMDSSNVLINIGASVVLEKSLEKAGVFLAEQLENLNNIQTQLSQGLQQLIQKIQEIRAEVERLAQQMQSQSRAPVGG
ncbi:MAG TPA: prefoldin subunit alpha [Candidatus Deferrimicrobium sp.]|nr:prefoldin subunit alpha [Candidatus Deferrimicrobium sp.]